MLYVYVGTDTNQTAERARAILARFVSETSGGHVERIESTAESLDLSVLVASQGLFASARAVLLDQLFENPDHKANVLNALQEIADSPHLFVIRETHITASERNVLQTYAKKLEIFDLKESGVQRNPFALADALIARDKKLLWLRLVQAFRNGSSAEELHGILFWGAKNLVLAKETEKESGLHPFVYKKTRAARAKFTEEEQQRLLAHLAVLPHEARRRGVELEYALERFALEFPNLDAAA